MGIFLIIFFGLIFFGGIYVSILKIKEVLFFKVGRNPFHRICKKCGAHQVQYQSNIEGCSDITWWQEVYPIGNDENCKCHKYAEYHG